MVCTCDADERTKCYTQKWMEMTKRKTQHQIDSLNWKGYRNEKGKLGGKNKKTGSGRIETAEHFS